MKGLRCNFHSSVVVFHPHVFGLFLIVAIQAVHGQANEEVAQDSWTDFWLTRLLLNVLGYASIVIPAWIIIHYVRRSGYLEKGEESSCGMYCREVNLQVMNLESRNTNADTALLAKDNLWSICFLVGVILIHLTYLWKVISRLHHGYLICPLHALDSFIWEGHGCLYTTVKACVVGAEEARPPSLEEGGMKTSTPEKSLYQKGVLLVICVAGLQASYLTWGVLQERIMAHEYGEKGEKFQNSQFLVFMNRILAFIAALTIMSFTKQPPHTAPLYKYSYCSLSNIMSSWCQYEALKFVTFPTQVMAKASKVIPVMLMGKVVSGKSYQYYEYVTAAMISIGVSMFLLSQKDDHKGSTVTTVSGVIILVGYMMFDSFTSNWQAELYSQYSMSSIQMMFGVNLFSCIFTSWSLIEQGGFSEGLEFMSKYSLFLFHVILLSICSATGQLFIFYTISQFGAVIFTIIMTTRQALAILLSCVIYGHPVSMVGIFGVTIVFVALFLRVYARTKKTKAKVKQVDAESNSNKV